VISNCLISSNMASKLSSASGVRSFHLRSDIASVFSGQLSHTGQGFIEPRTVHDGGPKFSSSRRTYDATTQSGAQYTLMNPYYISIEWVHRHNFKKITTTWWEPWCLDKAKRSQRELIRVVP
jgi:hypothetical protein